MKMNYVLTFSFALVFGCTEPSREAETVVVKTAAPRSLTSHEQHIDSLYTSLKGTFVTLDGYDPQSDTYIQRINVWDAEDNSDSERVYTAYSGDRVKIIGRGESSPYRIKVKGNGGKEGFINYMFIKELKE